MPRETRHLKQKKIVDAITDDPKNQTLSSEEVYEAKVRADKLEAERYDPFVKEVDSLNKRLLRILNGQKNA